MASFGDTQAAAVENQVWDTQVLQARIAAAVIMPRVLNRSALVAESGQVVHIPVKPKFVGGTVAADGTFTSEQQTLIDVQVNVNTWKYVSVEIPDKTSKQSIVTLETELPSQFGEQLSTFYDTDLANLFASFSAAGQVGSQQNPVQFIEDAALAAVLTLRNRNIPLKDMSWILPPEAFYLGWLTRERFTNANTMGLPKNVFTTNYRGPILNIPSYESTLLQNPAGTNALVGSLLHRESVAIAMQINNKYEKVRATAAGRLATIIVTHNLYGVIGVRSDHGVPMYIRNTQN